MRKKSPKQSLACPLARPMRIATVAGTVRKAMTARLLLLVGVTAALTFTSIVSAKHFGPWGAAIDLESIPGTNPNLNTSANDGCPYQSPDGLTLYMASNRAGSLGTAPLPNDIWIARRASTDDPWGEPENLGAPVNSPFNDFCPTPVRGHGLFFVSNRPHPDSCGGDDIYFTRFVNGAWEEPQNLGCDINSFFGEASPSYFEDEIGQAILYFSSTRPGGFASGGTDSDIYFSVDFGPAQLAPGVNTADNDFRPNVRHDGREIVFDSNRPGYTGTTANLDIWTSSRESTADDWSPPTNLGPLVNSPANETRASLSWDGLTLYFGSNRVSLTTASDIYVATREKLTGKKD